MSHLDARLNLARKSQILTRDLSLPIVPRLHPQEDERYCFIVEWLDPHSGLTMRYQMLYGPADCSVEMVRTRTRTPGDSFHSSPRQPKRLHTSSSPIRHESDHSAPSPVHPQYDIKNRRPFLKKTKIPTVTMDTLHMGAVVTVYSRQLKIVEYGDSHTEAAFSLARQQTLCVVKPGAVHLAGKVINASQKSGFSVARVKMAQLSSAEASAMFGEASASELSSGPSMGVSLVGDDAVSSFKALAKELVSSLGDCVVYSESADAVASQTSAFFANAPACRLADTALCLVKPSAMDHLGLVLDAVMGAGFTMTGASTFTLDRVDAVEFLEVYKGVVPEFAAAVDELTSGPFVAIEVAQSGSNGTSENGVVEALREACGPADPEIARVLRPNSIRAKFGFDKVRNAVHCTDLPEDGELETHYFFKILQNA
jgi:nucleoside-diphosphate kinase